MTTTKFEAWRKAADQGNADAQHHLGFMYRDGQGVPQDDVEAVKWYRKAADQGNVDAQFNLGFMYYEGRGVPLDYAEAVKWWRKAADQGNAGCQGNLGFMYDKGRGVPQDYAEAMKWYRKAADQGDAHAQIHLAELQFHRGGLSPSVPSGSSAPHRADSIGNGEPASDGSLPSNDSITTFLTNAFAGFVGLDSVRDTLFRQASYIEIQKRRAKEGFSVVAPPSRHLVFLGNAGTGKTEIARVVAGLYHQLGLLKTAKLVETDRAGLVAPYIGQTALQTKEVVESALGGVLFIDEAYSLARGGDWDFGREAVETLLKLMEDHRDDLIVIVAGYENEMNAFINLNPGLASRFNRTIHFPDYTDHELVAIFKKLCNRNSYVVSESICQRLRVVFAREIESQRPRFGNARYVRNLFERTVEAQAHRLYTSGNVSTPDLTSVMQADIEEALGEPLPAAPLD